MKIQGIGFSQTLKEVKNKHGVPVWFWEVKRFGKTLGHGYEAEKETAKEEAWKVTRAGMDDVTENSQAKAKHRMKVKYMLQSRPYLMMGLCNRVLKGFEKIRLMEEASELEQEFYAYDKSKKKKPLPTHHRTLRADIAAGQIFDAMVGAGYIKVNEDGAPVDVKRLTRWAVDMFGNAVWDGVDRSASDE
jgi:hypothetical protein